jgi:hypothetical protein
MAIKVYSPTDFEDTSSGVSIDGNLVVDTSVLYIDTTNNRVGIGITNPAYPFSVDVDTTGLISRIYNTNADGQGLLIRAGSTSSSTRVLQLASSNDTKIMTVTSSGNVGIGTTNPGFKLHVDKNATGYIARIQGDTNNISFYDGGSSGIGIGTDANQDLKLYVNDSLNSGIVIKSTGKVGIGTTSPEARLHIAGDHLLLSNGIELRSKDTGGSVRTIARVNGSTNDLEYGWSGAGAVKFMGGGAYTERMRIHTNGNVGIGTNSPAGKLDIRSGALFVGDYTGVVTPTDGIWLERPAGNSTQIQMYTTGASIFRISSDGTTANIGWGSGQDREVNFQNTGAGTIKVGIGTGSPDSPLTVTNNAASSYIINVNMADDVDGGGFYEATGGMELYLKDTSGTSQVKLTSSGSSYLNGGNVGIGTTSPSGILHVYKTGAHSYSVFENTLHESGIRIKNSQADWLIFTDDSSSNDIPTGSLGFWDNQDNALRVVFDGSGNVGIGTASPSEKLHVSGNVRIEGDLTVNGSYTQIDTDVNTTEQWNVTNDGTGPAVTINQTGAQDIMDVQDDGTSVFYIEDGGNVGIGTTSPGYKLDVAGSARIALTTDTRLIINQDTASTNFGLQLGYQGTRNWDIYNNGAADSKLFFFSEQLGASAVTFTPTGNVGIGTAIPGKKLHVAGDMGIDGYIYHNGDDSRIGFEGNDAIRMYTANSVRLQIDSSGNVGIGTTNPTARLRIAASTDDGILLESNNALLGNTGSGYTQLIYWNGSDMFYGRNTTGVPGGSGGTVDNHAFRTNGATRLFINSSGNVGIGTTSPSEKLHVTGTILSDQDEARIRFNSTSGTGRAYDMIGGNDGKFYFYDRTATSFRYVIDSSGNVGIGTTSPDALLTVSNTVDNGAAVRVQRTNALSGSYTEIGTVGGSGRIESFNGNLTVGADASNTDSSSVIQFKVDNSEKARITSSGNVGIGTTSPTAKLSVSGAILAGGKYSYRKGYGSLDTTGAAVAGLNGSFNGASAMFKFEMHGGVGHYQKVVYSCHNAGGNWVATKVIDEGTNELDVEASASNNTTITFTFKARNSTQQYSPAVEIEASGTAINTTYL